MYFSSVFITFVVGFLSVSASPTPVESSKPFKLVSKSLTPPFHFSNLYIETYHISPAVNYATLYPLSTQTQGVNLQLNGTATEFKRKNTSLILPLQGFSESWQVTKDGDTHPVQISVGEGTKGIFLDGKGNLQYSKPKSEGWYACNNTLLYGPAVQVFWKVKDHVIPKGCEDVQLEAQYV